MIAEHRRQTVRLHLVVKARPQRSAWWEDSDFVWWWRWVRACRAGRRTISKARRCGDVDLRRRS